MPGSGVTASYGAIDDNGKVQLSQETMARMGASDTKLPVKNSKVPGRKIRYMPTKKVSRVIDVQKHNHLKYNFTGVPETDPRACFNRSTWSPAVNIQQPPLGTSHLILGPGRIPNKMILIGTNNVSIGSDEEEAHWESMMVCLLTTLWQNFKCAVLTVCTVPMSTKTLISTGRRHNEGVYRWRIC